MEQMLYAQQQSVDWEEDSLHLVVSSDFDPRSKCHQVVKDILNLNVST